MLTASFTFTTTNATQEFLALDALILEAAEATEGYLGKESWIDLAGEKRNSVYYWEHEDGLNKFARHPKHIEAKKRYTEWYGGFHVVIAEVKKSYGDDAIETIAPNSRKRPRSI